MRIIRILFIAHFFPPLGGAGVQRSVKFCKYLPDFGVCPTVVTGSGRDSGRWAPEDPSLVLEGANAYEIQRAHWEVGDSSMRRSALITVGRDAIKKAKPEVIYVSMSPFSDATIADQLSREFKIPWVADLRDPWAFDEFQVHRTRFHRVLEKWRMRKALATASMVIMNTPEAARRVTAEFNDLADRVVALTNGYDAKDFDTPVTRPQNQKFTIVHSGTFHTEQGLRQKARSFEYGLLGRVERGVSFLPRSHYYLLEALQSWLLRQPEISQRIRLVLVGRLNESDIRIIKESKSRDLVEVLDYLPHLESVQMIRTADLLFLPLHYLPPGRRATIVPGKTYEYMASEVPILAALPEGDARDYLQQMGTGLLCAPNDSAAMDTILCKQYDLWCAGHRHAGSPRGFVERFERRALAEKLAVLLWDVATKERRALSTC